MKIIQCLIIIIIIVDVIHSFIRIGLGLGSVATFVCVCVRLTALQRQCRALSSTCTLHTFIWWTVGTGFWLVVVFISLCCVRSEWSMIDWYQYHAYAWVGIDWAAEKEPCFSFRSNSRPDQPQCWRRQPFKILYLKFSMPRSRNIFPRSVQKCNVNAPSTMSISIFNNNKNRFASNY